MHSFQLFFLAIFVLLVCLSLLLPLFSHVCVIAQPLLLNHLIRTEFIHAAEEDKH